MHPAHPEPQPSDESTPLLSDHVDLEAAKRKVPLPKGQLAALCISRLTDPIAYTQLFPYINQMLFDLRVTDDISKIGLYSGLVVCLPLFSFTPSYPHLRNRPLRSRKL